MADANITPRLLGGKDAALYLGIGYTTFKTLYRSGDLPPPIIISKRRKVWDRHDLDEMIEKEKGF